MPRLWTPGPDATLDATIREVGCAKIASAMGITPAAVHSWHRRGVLPAKRRARFDQIVQALRLLAEPARRVA